MTRAVLPVTVQQNADGSWRVETARGRKIIANNLTRDEAWRLWDERDQEISRRDDARRRIGYARGLW